MGNTCQAWWCILLFYDSEGSRERTNEATHSHDLVSSSHQAKRKITFSKWGVFSPPVRFIKLSKTRKPNSSFIIWFCSPVQCTCAVFT